MREGVGGKKVDLIVGEAKLQKKLQLVVGQDSSFRMVEDEKWPKGI